MKKNKQSITFVSNNYWTLYKFRYDVVQMFVKKGYSINLIAGKDKYARKFIHNSIKKFYIPINRRGANIFSEVNTFIKLYKVYKKLKTKVIFHFTIKPNIYGSIIAKFLNIIGHLLKIASCHYCGFCR